MWLLMHGLSSQPLSDITAVDVDGVWDVSQGVLKKAIEAYMDSFWVALHPRAPS